MLLTICFALYRTPRASPNATTHTNTCFTNQPSVSSTRFLASGFKELPAAGAMLLYLSADGSMGNSKHTDDSEYPRRIGSGEGMLVVVGW